MTTKRVFIFNTTYQVGGDIKKQKKKSYPQKLFKTKIYIPQNHLKNSIPPK